MILRNQSQGKALELIGSKKPFDRRMVYNNHQTRFRIKYKLLSMENDAVFLKILINVVYIKLRLMKAADVLSFVSILDDQQSLIFTCLSFTYSRSLFKYDLHTLYIYYILYFEYILVNRIISCNDLNVLYCACIDFETGLRICKTLILL